MLLLEVREWAGQVKFALLLDLRSLGIRRLSFDKGGGEADGEDDNEQNQDVLAHGFPFIGSH